MRARSALVRKSALLKTRFYHEGQLQITQERERRPTRGI